MGKLIANTELSDTLDLSECTDGFWLYDKTRGMNLAMRAKSATAALVEALSYYQTRLSDVESAHQCLQSRVDSFVAQFVEEERD